MGTNMHDAALALAAAGTPIFPCYPYTVSDKHKLKSPMTPTGFQDATADLGQVERWWSAWPGAAIGMPTGIVYDVLDVDRKPNGPDGYEALKKLRANGIVRSDAISKIVKTPSGGMHIYFPASGTMGNASFRKSGIDLRGVGGYVLVDPSVLYEPTGAVIGTYELASQRGEGAPLDHEALRKVLTPPRPAYQGSGEGPASGDIETLTRFMANVKEGGRNAALFWAACAAIEDGYDPHDLTSAALRSGLEPWEIRRTIESAERKKASA